MIHRDTIDARLSRLSLMLIDVDIELLNSNTTAKRRDSLQRIPSFS